MAGWQKFYSLNPQFYQYLWGRGDKTKPAPESFARVVKENQNLSSIDFTHKLKKAASGGHDALLFDSAFLVNKNFERYLDQTKRAEIQPVLQISSAHFESRSVQIEGFIKSQPFLEIHLICEEKNPVALKKLQIFKNRVSLLYVITKKNRYSFFKNKTSHLYFKKAYLYFPYKQSFWDSFLTPKEVYKFIQQETELSAYPVETYDGCIPEDIDLEPLFTPFFENQLPAPADNDQLDFSIVIPCYDSKKQLINTLQHLYKQDFPKNKYEIIVVDDGSLDHIREELQFFSQSHCGLNIKGIYFPRVIEKNKNSARFRAGLARNLGVKHSRGSFLVFLDSDILTPPDYLKRLQKEHERADVVLVKRHHLKSNVSLDQLFSKQEIQSSYIADKGYWGAFYQKGFDEVKYPWKYVCTYGLSLLKKDFEEFGAFGKNFLSYGFEDVDLGYRLFKNNRKFFLSDIKVYHQAPSDENQMNWLLRQRKLFKTAKIFFYRHLDPEIYQALQVYMRQERAGRYFL